MITWDRLSLVRTLLLSSLDITQLEGHRTSQVLLFLVRTPARTTLPELNALTII